MIKVKFNEGGVFQRLIDEVEEEATKKSKISNVFHNNQSVHGIELSPKNATPNFCNFMVNFSNKFN